MFESLLFFGAVFILLFLPLLLWFYILSEFGEYSFSKREFIIGIISGILLVGIFSFSFFSQAGYYLESLTQAIWLHDIQYIGVFISLFFLGLWGIYMIYYALIKQKKIYVSGNIFSYILCLGAVGISGVFLYMLPLILGTWMLNEKILIQDVYIHTGVLLMSYYIVIALLEEGSKFLAGSGLYTPWHTLELQKCFCIAACIALGFAFMENVLYLSVFLKEQSDQWSLLIIVCIRSIFSVTLHVFAGIFFALTLYILYRSSFSVFYKMLGISVMLSLSLLSHAWYDVALSLGYNIFLPLYTFALYLLLSYLGFRRGI